MLRGNLVAGLENARAVDREPSEGSRISVCHIASGDRWAGAEAQMAFLLRELSRRKEFAICAILLNEGKLADEIRQSGIEVKIIPENKKSFFAILADSTRYIRGKNIQIVHSHRYKENLLAALLAWRCGVPNVVRSQQGLSEPFRGAKHLKQACLHYVDRVVARYATDRVIAASDDLRKVMLGYVRPGRVTTVHNCVDLDQTRSNLSLPEAQKRLGIPRGSRVVGFAGRLEPIKRVDIFLSAASQINARIPESLFVIVGDGSEATRLRELAKSLGITGRVLFLGHRSDIHDVIRAFDVLVLCSDHEGLPTILAESLYLGVATVARAVGGVPEVIQDGVNGVLVKSHQPSEVVSELGTACVAILNDDAYRKRLASAGASWIAEKFSSEQTAAGVAEVYRSLCEAR